MPIRLLPPDVSSKIAAGEVIERPASVVKELLENSLDAGATEVSVEIREGGAEHIRVADNGSGIAFDEVELALQRFATSKIAGVDDLESIATLGFRGEALPSVAAVSHMTLVTRHEGEDTGARVEVAEGEVGRKEPQGAARGTVVTVRRLFGNLPARRKFLRSKATETSRIHALVTRYALAYPEVRFQLSSEGSTTFSSSGSGGLRDAVVAVYGREVAEAMLEVSPTDGAGSDGHSDASVGVSGMIGPPSLTRANRGYVSLFVNGRWVQSRALGYALEQAYHGFLMERRYPVAVVFLNVAAEDVDVNAHPAKTEVRFRREGQVFAALQQAVRRTVTAHSPVPGVRGGFASTGVPTRQQGAAFWPTTPFAAPSGSHVAACPADSPVGSVAGASPPPAKALPVLRVLGQVQNTYVVAEGPDGMYLIDQHAAHERVVFEKVRAEVASRAAEVQSLLEPVTAELSPEQAELLESQTSLVHRLGLLVEPFGGLTFLVRGVPALLAGGDPARVLIDVLDTMAEGGDFETWEDRAAYSVACHGAIRAGKVLSREEMAELTRRLEECVQPNTCPHGRPTMVHMSAGQLEREFGRR